MKVRVVVYHQDLNRGESIFSVFMGTAESGLRVKDFAINLLFRR